MTVEEKGEFYYIGQISNNFKSRMSNYLSDIKLRHRQGEALSKFIWGVKDEQKTLRIMLANNLRIIEGKNPAIFAWMKS